MCYAQVASLRPAVGLFLLLFAVTPIVRAQSASPAPTVPIVLARATAQVTVLHRRLFGMVAEERYDQRSTSPSGGGLGGASRDLHEWRRLRSDYLLVQPEGERTATYSPFRRFRVEVEEGAPTR